MHNINVIKKCLPVLNNNYVSRIVYLLQFCINLFVYITYVHVICVLVLFIANPILLL